MSVRNSYSTPETPHLWEGILTDDEDMERKDIAEWVEDQGNAFKAAEPVFEVLKTDELPDKMWPLFRRFLPAATVSQGPPSGKSRDSGLTASERNRGLRC